LQLRRVCEINPLTPEFGALDPDEPVTFLPLEAVWADALDTSRERSWSELDSGYTRFREGDVLVPKITPTFEASRSTVASGLRKGIGCGTTELHVLRPRPELNTRFLFYVAHSRRFLAEGTGSMQGVAGQKRVPESLIAGYVVDLPPVDEQTRIADSLDRETARIDGLIRHRRDLFRLLSLRRSAYLANAVLGRLDRGVELTATGDPHVPELPQGWIPVRLRSVATEITVGVVVTPAAFYADEGLPFLRGYNIRPGVVTDHDLAWISPESNAAHPKSILRPGDVLVVRTGQAGAAAVVPDWAVGGNCVDVLIVRSAPSLRPTFLELVLNSELASRQVDTMSVGAIQSHFNVGALRDLHLPLPPLKEQDRLVALIEHEGAQSRHLMDAVDRQIALLGERRQALITAAVGGQINIPRRPA